MSKRYGTLLALDDVTLHARPGRVTALLGRNGAGKSTLLSMMAGLTLGEGRVEFDGVALADLPCPPLVVGFVFDGGGFHPRRSSSNHLRMLARATGVPTARASACLEAVGLAGRRKDAPRTFSYGMRQRLALASVMLADPPIVVLDEPLNGLDPPGTIWLRQTLRRWADEGRTVLLSSHNLPEVEQVADDVFIIESGRLVQQGTLGALLRDRRSARVVVSAVDVVPLANALRGRGGDVVHVDDRTVRVTGLGVEQVGTAARDAGSILLGLHEETARLEDIVLGLGEKHEMTA